MNKGSIRIMNLAALYSRGAGRSNTRFKVNGTDFVVPNPEQCLEGPDGVPYMMVPYEIAQVLLRWHAKRPHGEDGGIREVKDHKEAAAMMKVYRTFIAARPDMLRRIMEFRRGVPVEHFLQFMREQKVRPESVGDLSHEQLVKLVERTDAYMLVPPTEDDRANAIFGAGVQQAIEEGEKMKDALRGPDLERTLYQQAAGAEDADYKADDEARPATRGRGKPSSPATAQGA